MPFKPYISFVDLSDVEVANKLDEHSINRMIAENTSAQLSVNDEKEALVTFYPKLHIEHVEMTEGLAMFYHNSFITLMDRPELSEEQLRDAMRLTYQLMNLDTEHNVIQNFINEVLDEDAAITPSYSAVVSMQDSLDAFVRIFDAETAMGEEETTKKRYAFILYVDHAEQQLRSVLTTTMSLLFSAALGETEVGQIKMKHLSGYMDAIIDIDIDEPYENLAAYIAYLPELLKPNDIYRGVKKIFQNITLTDITSYFTRFESSLTTAQSSRTDAIVEYYEETEYLTDELIEGVIDIYEDDTIFADDDVVAYTSMPLSKSYDFKDNLETLQLFGIMEIDASEDRPIEALPTNFLNALNERNLRVEDNIVARDWNERVKLLEDPIITCDGVSINAQATSFWVILLYIPFVLHILEQTDVSVDDIEEDVEIKIRERWFEFIERNHMLLKTGQKLN